MKSARAIGEVINGASFSFYTPDDVRKLSVKQLTNSVTFDELQNPVEGGLYDPSLGPLERKSGACPTCGLNDIDCPGHFGHIELPVPLYNPITFSTCFRLLQSLCFNCHHFRVDAKRTARYVLALRLVQSARLDEARRLMDLDEASKSEAKLPEWLSGAELFDESKIKVRKADEDTYRLSLSKHATTFRAEIVRRFLAQMQADQRCAHCGALKLRLKKEGNLKIFQRQLPDNKIKEMVALGAKYASPFKTTRAEDDADTGKGKHKHEHVEEEEEADDVTRWVLKLGQELADADADASDDESDSDSDSDADKRRTKKAADSDSESDSDDDSDDDGKRRAQKKKKEKEKKKKAQAKTREAEKARQERTPKGRSEARKDAAATASVAQRFMMPQEVLRHLELLWDKERTICSLAWSGLTFASGALEESSVVRVRARVSSPEMFFLHVLAVPPTRFRPPAVTNDMLTEHPQNIYLSRVLAAVQELEGLDRRDRASTRFSDIIVRMQSAVNGLMDHNSGDGNPSGIKQILEKKKGLFRQNMMGKRVNFAARSVISPDPYLDTNEIGLPLYFAKNLTYPEPVTAYNVKWLRQLVINGPDVYPGARAIEDEDGNIIHLSAENKAKRIALAKMLEKPDVTAEYGLRSHGVKRVLRHAHNGDMLLVNRQPTLHKPSIMAHIAHIMGQEKTISMHYANCSTYNADFDGDEMNLHLAQSELAKAEARLIAINDNQYVGPRDGNPLRGLIQDHIVSGVLMTCLDTFFTAEEFQQLVYFACVKINPQHRIVTPEPAILRPRALWTGKQVFSAVIAHLLRGKQPLSMDGSTQVPGNMWGKSSMEGLVTIRRNELLTGVLGKKNFGNKAHGLVHCIYEMYGPQYSGQMLSTLGRLLTHHMQMRGFTCGLDDLLIDARSEAARYELLTEASTAGLDHAAVFAHVLPEPAKGVSVAQFRAQAAQQRREVMERLEQLLVQPDEYANWDAYMIGKSGKITSAVIDACPGLVKRFPRNNFSLMTTSGAKGSRVNFSMVSCLLGQQELEGKRPPMMVTGKTLPSFEPYDPSPRAGGFIGGRFLTGIPPQEFYFHCMAGREGLVDTAVKTSRSGYLQRCIIKHLEGIAVQYDHTARDAEGAVIQFYYGEDAIDVTRTAFLHQFDFLRMNAEGLREQVHAEEALAKMKRVKESKIAKVKRSLEDAERHPGRKRAKDPLIAKYLPGSHIGAVSEKFEAALSAYIDKSFTTRDEARAKDFRQLCYMKYRRSLAEPGENVGTLAGQSIGEPSTQMTLNTFHLAGKGEVNVTLGIPRLRELLMTNGGHLKTPFMMLPLRAEYSNQAKAEQLARRLKSIALAEVLNFVEVREALASDDGGRHFRKYDVALHLLDFTQTTSITWRHFRAKMSDGFVPHLVRAITAMLKQSKPPPVGRADDKFRYIDEVAVLMKEGERALGDDDHDEGDAAPRVSKAVAKARDKANEDDLGTLASARHGKHREGAQYDDDEEEGEDAEDALLADLDRGAQIALNTDSEDGSDAEHAHPAARESTTTSAQLHASTKKEYASPYLHAHALDEKQRVLRVELHLPANKNKLLMVSIVEEQARRFLVQEVQGLHKCAVLAPTDKAPQYVLQTAGINFAQIWRLYDVIDVHNLYSNDLAQILLHYGVEAARAAIIKECAGVFGAYGIDVNYRHLSLIADYMTFEGALKPFNRMGMRTGVSPLQKMSFETTMQFLTEATVHGDYDAVHSPSARLVFGIPVGLGTGSFEVRQDLTHSVKE